MLALHQPHSDIHLLLMILYYHQQKYLKVRQHFQHILTFKVIDNRAYWVAAEAEFSMEESESCLRLTEECMERLEERCLPRLIHMKARCYEWQHNYINSIVCYNQLLKMKPKVAEYYLQRGILYHRIGYYK
jgi:tetratricopeptide (TPR) repeat protein